MANGAATMEADHNTHGAPMPQHEIDQTKEKLGLPAKKFYVPTEVIDHFTHRFSDLTLEAKHWKGIFKNAAKETELKHIIASTISGKIISEFETPAFKPGDMLATRKAFGAVLDSIAGSMPQLVGGSADLEPSNYTGNFAKTYGDFQKNNNSGRNIPFGVREFPMAAIMNGMALHGGIIPYGGTFLTFSDYCRGAIRLSALMGLEVIYVMTHDSIGLGEDGPTHQPIEHLASLRSIPNLNVFRPCDIIETIECWEIALKSKHKPSIICLSRQNLPLIRNEQGSINRSEKGAYIVKDFINKCWFWFILIIYFIRHR